MIRIDWILHFLVCALIVLTFGSLWVGIPLALLAAFGKEGYDQWKYKGWDWKDLIADGLGIAYGVIVFCANAN